MLALIFCILSCQPVPDNCPELEFEDIWWQLNVAGTAIGDCYKFLDDGRVIVTDGLETWPNGYWYGESHGCDSLIFFNDSEYILSPDGDCLTISLDSNDYTACECLGFV